ncbi:MAG: hypothetical protein ABSB49_19275 [Polyangia bacterium]
MLRTTITALALLVTSSVLAQDAPETAKVNGYVSQRLMYQLITPDVPESTRDLPSLATLTEANVQLRVNLGSEAVFAYADLSLVFQGGWLFYEDNGNGGRASVPDHDVPALHPDAVPSELYLSASPKPWLNLLVGKKRITWGSGFAFNPTDLINPPKDPTDPNYQRAGNWVARVELPFERFTVSALFAPQALYAQSGLPYAFMRYPDYPPATGPDTRDETSHYLVAGRLYALVASADVNLIYYFSNAYQDDFRNKSRVGLSLSRYFFTDYELHAEALFTRGSARSFPVSSCTTAPCPYGSFTTSEIGSTTLYPRVITGTRRLFDDESLFSVEYYYQGDGYSDQEFSDAVAIQSYLKNQPSTTSASTGNALPQRYAFDPLRRHYLIVSYSKPHVADDWTLSGVLIAGLRDLSGIFSPSVVWSARQWIDLGLYAFIPIHGLGVGEVHVDDQSFSEFGLSPYAFQVLFEARAYY